MSLPPDHREAPTRLASLVRRITPNCREVARLTSEEHDRDLPRGVRMRLALHRSFCTWCARYAKQLDLLHESSHRLSEHLDHIDEGALSGDAKARVKRALQELPRDDAGPATTEFRSPSA